MNRDELLEKAKVIFESMESTGVSMTMEMWHAIHTWLIALSCLEPEGGEQDESGQDDV